MNDKPKSRWYWSVLRWGLIGLAALVTLTAIVVTEENWRGKRAWIAYKQAAAARGDRLDIAAAPPAPVTDEENFYAAPLVAEALQRLWQNKTNEVNPLDLELWRGDSRHWPNEGGNWAKRTVTDLKPWQQYFRTYSQSPEGKTNGFPVSAEPQTPAADVLLALSTFDKTLEALRQASLRPRAMIPLHYDRGFEDVDKLLPLLSFEKKWGRVLQLRAEANINAGHAQAALDDIKFSLRLADTLREQPYLISHLVHLALINIHFQSVYEGIAAHCWDDAQLKDLEAALGQEDFLKDYLVAMRGERTCGLAYIENMRLTRELKQEFPGGGAFTNSLFWVPSAFFYQNELAIARGFDEFLLPIADVTNHLITMSAYHQAQSRAEHKTHSPYKVLAYMSFPGLSKSIAKFAYIQAQIDLARTACALERFRLAHGGYPDSLAPLAPDYISAVPHDLINGQPLHYRRTDDGLYVLYSVGWNEADDGGVVVIKKDGTNVDYDKGDWVWQLPAK